MAASHRIGSARDGKESDGAKRREGDVAKSTRACVVWLVLLLQWQLERWAGHLGTCALWDWDGSMGLIMGLMVWGESGAQTNNALPYKIYRGRLYLMAFRI